MDPSDALYARLALQREWISRPVHDDALRRADELRARGISKSVEDVLREGKHLDEERLRVLRRLLSRFTRQARIGDYTILRRIGVGGTGMVFEARHRRVGRRVAIKVLFPRLERSPGMVERFLREARALAQIDHPNVVHAYDAGRDGAFCYIAMEIVEGEDLGRVLERRGPLPPREAALMLLPVARALEAIHRAGFLHRDVKPTNILIATDGTIKLVDLGLYFARDDGRVLWDGVIFGTPRYMSPEQVRDDPSIDPRSDLYSLGTTLYHALVGRPPFDGETTQAIVRAHLQDPAAPPRDIVPEIPPELDDLVVRLLRKDPSERPGTALEVVRALERLLGLAPAAGSPPGRAPGERARRRAKWAWGAVGAALVAIAVTLIGERLMRDRAPGEDAQSATPEPAAPQVAVEKAAPQTVARAVTAAGQSVEVARPTGEDVARLARSVEALVSAGSDVAGATVAAMRDAMPDPSAVLALVAPGRVQETVLPTEVARWSRQAAERVVGAFVARLRSIEPGDAIVLRVIGSGSVRSIPVRVEVGAGPDVRLVEVEGGRPVALEAVHPSAILAWGALSTGDADLAVGYCLVAGRPGWAAWIRERLDPELPPAVAAHVEGAPSRVDGDQQDRLVERVLELATRNARAHALLEAGEWEEAGTVFASLAGEAELPDSMRGLDGEWTRRARRARELAWLTGRLFAVPGSVDTADDGVPLRLAYPFDDRAELADFRMRPGRWAVREGRLAATGSAGSERLDTVALFRLPVVVAGAWSPERATDRGRLVVIFEEIGIGLGGPAGDFTLFRPDGADEDAFAAGAPTGRGGRFRIEIAPERIRAELPGDVRVDTATAGRLPAFGRVAIALDSGCALEELEIVAEVDPIWTGARIAAIED